MASCVGEENLIDLDGGTYVPSCVTLSKMTLEEQEHLLDVYPPKLQQKLSLSREQKLIHEQQCDNVDILVTLGHDQVVPIQKRIDVVSSETIKRVRDITKNLEPVMSATHQQSSVDNLINERNFNNSCEQKECNITPTCDDSSHFDESCATTFEAQAISAFNFLSDIDNNENNCPDNNCDNNENNPGINELNNSIFSEDSEKSLYPLEPVCLIKNNRDKYSNTNNNCHENKSAINPDEFDYHMVLSSCDNDKQISEQISKETSCSDKLTRSISQENCEPSTSVGITATGKSRHSIRRSETSSSQSSECSDVDWSWIEDIERRRCTKCNLKSSSSSLMSSPPSSACSTSSLTCGCANAITKAARTSSPSDMSNITNVLFMVEPEGLHGRMRSLPPSNIGWSSRVSMNSSVAMSVDATGKALVTSVPNSNNNLNQFDNVTTSVPSSSSSSSLSLSVSSTTTASITPSNQMQNLDSSTVVVDTTPSAMASSEDNNIRRSFMTRELNNAVGNSPASSWLRASMRRLRHLRLPEAERTQRSMTDSNNLPISGPNSLPDIALIAPEILAANTNANINNNQSNRGMILRPSSAPVRSNDNGGVESRFESSRRGRRNSGQSRSINQNNERFVADQSISNDSGLSSRNNSMIHCGDSDNSAGVAPMGNSSTRNVGSSHQSPETNPNRRIGDRRQRDVDGENERNEEDDDENPTGKWPHALSPALACLSCTLGLFNISRFAILSVQFGANFIIQFLILSLILGIPLFTFHVCLGQRLAAGAVDMWKISPVFHGVGIALLVAHAFIGIYSITGVSWMFVYFRDSFITKQDRYRWAEPFLLYREDIKPMNITISYKLHETVPDYFSGVVLQRHHLNEPDPGVITIKFQVAFNLAVVWMIVFVSLSKGLRSYGKVVYVFTLVPVFGTLILCTKLLGLTPPGTIHQLFPATVWSEFFINSKSWIAASSEVFLTWGLLGAAAMQIAAHNKHKHLLQRDTGLVIVLTFVVLLLVAFLANTCAQILRFHGYVYMTSSFEKLSGYMFMRPVNQLPPSGGYSNTPERFMTHASFLLGERTIRPGADLSSESGYQVLRLSTELVPATLAILGTDQVSPFWAILFYFNLIFFGIAQQLAIWHCVITGIMAINAKMMKLWETTITFFSCACAYILSLPMATELGIYVVYYLDYTIGGAWWIMILYLVQVGAVFAVRGRPHTGEAVVAELFPPTGRCLRYWAGPLLSFTWNVILPIALMIMSIVTFKTSGFRDLYTYKRTVRTYWAIWARQLGASTQLIPILIIPVVAIIQTCRYLNSGPPDIFDRIQLLYRPSLERESVQINEPSDNNTNANIENHEIRPNATDIPFADPPPKYTPPPSYTTATGARIAKMLRQSFRRSVRRIANVLGESSVQRARPAISPPPPDYATVLVEMNQTIINDNEIVDVNERHQPDVLTDTGNRINERLRPNTIGRIMRVNTFETGCPIMRTQSTIERNRRLHTGGFSNLTATDVANLLRSSIRRGTARTQQSFRRNSLHICNAPPSAISVENLVSAAAPIGEDLLEFPKDIALVPKRYNNDDCDEEDKKTVEMDNTVSVI